MLSYHLFSEMHENRTSIGDFYGLNSFNFVSYFVRLGLPAGLMDICWGPLRTTVLPPQTLEQPKAEFERRNYSPRCAANKEEIDQTT